jgi:hypothetical protein
MTTTAFRRALAIRSRVRATVRMGPIATERMTRGPPAYGPSVRRAHQFIGGARPTEGGPAVFPPRAGVRYASAGQSTCLEIHRADEQGKVLFGT